MFDTSLETSGIFTVDSHYTGELVAAIYVMIENDEVAIIETGTSASVEHIEKIITDNGLTWDNVKYVIPTHVHLDHSAGAGVLMQKCSNANLVIHPRGARHMADPSKLIAGARQFMESISLENSMARSLLLMREELSRQMITLS